jgi:hypothetical protein
MVFGAVGSQLLGDPVNSNDPAHSEVAASSLNKPNNEIVLHSEAAALTGNI